jgi:hypothetical protein
VRGLAKILGIEKRFEEGVNRAPAQPRNTRDTARRPR